MAQAEEDEGAPSNPYEITDAVHRADFPRTAIRSVHGYDRCQEATERAENDANRWTRRHGQWPYTLDWFRVYIASLDKRADKQAPGWRYVPAKCGPFAWAVEQFGPVHPDGDLPEMPRDIRERGDWERSGLNTRQWWACRAPNQHVPQRGMKE